MDKETKIQKIFYAVFLFFFLRYVFLNAGDILIAETFESFLNIFPKQDGAIFIGSAYLRPYFRYNIFTNMDNIYFLVEDSIQTNNILKNARDYESMSYNFSKKITEHCEKKDVFFINPGIFGYEGLFFNSLKHVNKKYLNESFLFSFIILENYCETCKFFQDFIFMSRETGISFKMKQLNIIEKNTEFFCAISPLFTNSTLKALSAYSDVSKLYCKNKFLENLPRCSASVGINP